MNGKKSEKMITYKDLIVWQKSISLVTKVYTLTKQYPNSEIYCLVSQIRRAAISIPSNIAEGYRRKSIGDYLRFLYIANASASELETQIIISKNIYQNFNYSEVDNLLIEVIKMLNSLISKLETKRTK